MLKKLKNVKFWASLLSLSLFLTPQYSDAQINSNAGIENKVRAAFPNSPDMVTIAQCESGLRQFGPDGTPLRGGVGKSYIGIFQIDEKHVPSAIYEGYDINTIDGNIGYAKHMFSKSGTTPWKSCLKSPSAAASAKAVSGALTTNMNFGMSNPQVIMLQQLLNKNGFVIAASGPGSPGNETAYFGALTREAVRKFQCAKGIVCSGSESTTGFGRVGPFTRASLNQLGQ